MDPSRDQDLYTSLVREGGTESELQRVGASDEGCLHNFFEYSSTQGQLPL